MALDQPRCIVGYSLLSYLKTLTIIVEKNFCYDIPPPPPSKHNTISLEGNWSPDQVGRTKVCCDV